MIECDSPGPGALGPIRTRSGAKDPAVGLASLVPIRERFCSGSEPQVAVKPVTALEEQAARFAP